MWRTLPPFNAPKIRVMVEETEAAQLYSGLCIICWTKQWVDTQSRTHSLEFVAAAHCPITPWKFKFKENHFSQVDMEKRPIIHAFVLKSCLRSKLIKSESTARIMRGFRRSKIHISLLLYCCVSLRGQMSILPISWVRFVQRVSLDVQYGFRQSWKTHLNSFSKCGEWLSGVKTELWNAFFWTQTRGCNHNEMLPCRLLFGFKYLHLWTKERLYLNFQGTLSPPVTIVTGTLDYS